MSAKNADQRKRKRIREEYTDLISEIRQNETEISLLNKSIDQTDKLFEQVQNPREALCDAKLLNLQSDIIKERTLLVQTNLTVFEYGIYHEKLFLGVTQRRRRSSAHTKDGSVFSFLGTKSKLKLTSTPPLQFLYGSFKNEDVKVKRKPACKKVVDEPTAPIQRPEQVTASDSNSYDRLLRDKASYILGIIERCLKKENQPIPYFEFVTDPASFSKTIENMFYLSLLVKTSRINIVEASDGQPCISSIIDVQKAEFYNSHGHSTESILSISMDEWENIVKAFHIKKAMIT